MKYLCETLSLVTQLKTMSRMDAEKPTPNQGGNQNADSSKQCTTATGPFNLSHANDAREKPRPAIPGKRIVNPAICWRNVSGL